jgi:single-stranded-DNA-specific exonuclease
VIGFQGGQGKGSARSIRGFHMVEGFRRCAEHLEKFGGHEYAGGLSIKGTKLELFVDAFENVAREFLAPDDLLPVLDIDAQLMFADIGFPLMRELESLKPFGVGNPEPLFMSETVEVCERNVFSTGARFRLRQNGRVLGGVAFGVGEDFPGIPGTNIDVVYRLGENEWNGTKAVELKIVNARLAAAGNF